MMKRYKRGMGLLSALILLLAFTGMSYAQTGTLAGTVTDAQTDQTLGGATVFIPSLERGSAVDFDGNFEITGLPVGTYTVRINFIGYRTVERQVTINADEVTRLNVQLRTDRLALEEVVVTGTAGETRQREMGSTVSRINVDNVTEPISNMDNLLQGRVNAMTVNPGSGTMGAGAQIRLRGNVSVTQSNQPLIYIDGVRQGSDAYPLNRSDGAAFWQSPQSTAGPLNDLNPSDIERVEVIKGASAATLYGSEAAAGVIQIFTKRGSEGAPRWRYQTDHHFDNVQKFGSDQRPYINMDPFLKTAYSQKHNLSVRGGGADVQYFVSGNFGIGEGIHPNDEKDDFSLRANFTIRPASGLSIDFNNYYSNQDMKITHVGNNLYSIQFNAFRAPGNTVGSDDPEVIGQLLDAYVTQENIRYNSSITTRYTPVDNMVNRLTVGLDRMESNMSHITPFGYILNSQGSISEQTWQNTSYTIDYVGSYSFNITQELSNRFSWGGQSVIKEDYLLDGFGQGLPGPGEHTLSSAAERLTFSESFRVIDTGGFLETMFDYSDRYFLTLGFRVDGNSTFGEDYGLQFYPKASFSYVISDESFWPENFGQFRLRAAYGFAGRAPGAFDAVRTWNPLSFAGQSAFIPQNVGNPNLGPERTREFETGFEASFLDENLSLNFTYYNQRTIDALLNVGQIPTLGFIGSQLENVGELKNEGIEIELSSTLVRRQNYFLDVGLSLATNSSEVLDTAGQTFYTIVEGQPIPAVRGTRVTNPDAIADPEFERDHFFGPNQPTEIVGLNLTAGLPYGMRINAAAEYQGGHWITQSSQWAMTNRGAGAPACDDVYELIPHGEWSANHQNAGQVNAYQRAHCYNDFLESGLFNEPADFIKLRNLSLYMPINFLVGDLVRNTALSFAVSNIRLWTHEDFSAFDPEMVWSREGITALTTGIPETTPSPVHYSMSLRIDF